MTFIYAFAFEGQPVGWCIADIETTEVIEIFLSRIKRRSPNTDVKVVMTDDGTTTCNSH